MALLQRPEGTKLDFKQQLSLKTDTDKKELAKDVSAIANSKGGRGYIIFGVTDKTKKVVGIEEKKYTEEQIQQIISQRCEPPINIKLELLETENKVVGILVIYKSSQKPHQIRQTGAFYVRRGSTTDIARRDEIAAMLQEAGIIQCEKMLLNNIDLKELDIQLLDNFLTKAGVDKNSEDYYAVMELNGIIGRDEDYSKYHPTVGGLLLFGCRPQKILNHTGIRVIDNLHKNEIKYFEGPILKLLDDVEEYLKNLIDNKNYPIFALVDTLVNAAVHRDYYDVKREIVVLVDKNKIEISNPGSLCGDDELTSTFEEVNFCRRNPWLYHMLLSIDTKGRFLKSGMGLKRINEAFKNLGEVRFLSIDKRNMFKVILPGAAEK